MKRWRDEEMNDEVKYTNIIMNNFNIAFQL